jgi:glc operon protein GlcG
MLKKNIWRRCAMRSKSVLTSVDTYKIMSACKAEAETNNWAVSIAIVDDAGNLLLFERLDGASVVSSKTCIGKAQTSAAFSRPSKAVAKLISDMPGLVALPVGLPLEGAVPLLYQNECVGAVGVGGKTPSEDEQVARAGASAFL